MSGFGVGPGLGGSWGFGVWRGAPGFLWGLGFGGERVRDARGFAVSATLV